MDASKVLKALMENLSVFVSSVLVFVATFFIANKFSDPVYTALTAVAVSGMTVLYLERLKYGWVQND